MLERVAEAIAWRLFGGAAYTTGLALLIPWAGRPQVLYLTMGLFVLGAVLLVLGSRLAPRR